MCPSSYKTYRTSFWETCPLPVSAGRRPFPLFVTPCSILGWDDRPGPSKAFPSHCWIIMPNLVTLRHLVWACVDVKHFYRVSLCVNAVLTSCLPESVRLSVTLVYCSQTIIDIVESSFFARYAMAIILLLEAIRCYPIPIIMLSAWALNTKCVKNVHFSTEITVYLGNGTRQAHGCYRTLIWNDR